MVPQFDAGSKCCTYHPHLAPHFVGALLASGNALVEERLRRRVGVTPLGLGAPPGFSVREFGRDDGRCPFHAEGRCTIWESRGPACAAFHCRFERGPLGAQLWQLILYAWNGIERALNGMLLQRHGLSAEACDALLRAPEDAALDTAAWGRLRGREAEYFLDAHALIPELSWKDVAKLGHAGPLGEALRGAVERLHALQLPERVQPGPAQLVQLGSKVRAVSPAAPFDALELPAELLPRLQQPGRLAALGLNDAQARQLLDWAALVPA